MAAKETDMIFAFSWCCWYRVVCELSNMFCDGNWYPAHTQAPKV